MINWDPNEKHPLRYWFWLTAMDALLVLPLWIYRTKVVSRMFERCVERACDCVNWGDDNA